MWMINPKILCKNHLLGEHNELHKFMGSMRLGRSMNGYVDKGEIEPRSWFDRHEELVNEMLLRWPKERHASPINKSELNELLAKTFTKAQMLVKIDWWKSLEILLSRCEECRKRKELLLMGDLKNDSQ
jgi:hypothetical protein